MTRAPTRVLRIMGGAGVALFLGAAFTPLPDLLSRWMSVAGPLKRATAIVVLGGGGVRPDGTLSDSSVRRTLHGIRLYRQGLAPLLVFSGPAIGAGRVEAELRADLARECGISPTVILTQPAGRTTREEAVKLSRLLRPRGISTILLVGDAEGARRAMGVFEKAGFEVLPAPAADVSRYAQRPEERLELARRVALESVAWLYYRLAGYL